MSIGGRLCRGKDKEIALLRAALVERDGRLQAGRAELLQARMELQEKDEELVLAYQRLTEACQQRSSVRAALIGTQTELAATSAELDAWTHELATFQTELAEMVSYLESTSVHLHRLRIPCCGSQTIQIVASTDCTALWSRLLRSHLTALKMERPEQMLSRPMERHQELRHLESKTGM